MSIHQCLDDGMKWRIGGSLKAGLPQIQICREFNITPSVMCSTYGNRSRLPDSSRASLGKVVREPRLPEELAICLL
ncbi:uncharacterized protein TNCV_64641 [Trichonephila clavipes]|nr:uncharacterized protein TNCV_64641 [Trichonephila clavipes]